MNISSIINSPLLGLVSMFVPQAAPIIAMIQRAAPIITAAEPVIRLTISEGRPAFEAATAAAPQLTKIVKDLFNHLPGSTVLGSVGEAIHFENITRGLVGFHPMTLEEERVWMDNATPHNDPSQENSRFGGG